MGDTDDLAQLRGHAWQYLITHRTEAMTLLAESDLTDEYAGLLQRLVLFLGDRGRGVLALLEADLDWDAEIVLRSYYECASKILYLALCPQGDRTRLVEEFEVVLAEAGDKRRARKAALAEKAAVGESTDVRDVFRLMHDKRMVRISAETTKRERQAVEARWSFSGIISSLRASTLDGIPLTEIESLLHIYGMASHLAHADSGALDFMEDRARRGESELTVLKAAHRARIINDIASLGALCSLAIGQAASAPKGWMTSSLEWVGKIHRQSAALSARFYEDQRPFYDRMFGRAEA